MWRFRPRGIGLRSPARSSRPHHITGTAIRWIGSWLIWIFAASWWRERWRSSHVWWGRSEEHTSELQSLMRISYAVFCLKKKKNNTYQTYNQYPHNTYNAH